MTFKEIKNLIYSYCEVVVDNEHYSFMRDIINLDDFDNYEVIGIRSNKTTFDSYIVVSLKKGD